jgi:hypothetical protein
MHQLRSLLAVGVLALGGACGKGSKSAPPSRAARPPAAARPAGPSGPAEYTVIVKSTWTKANFPLDYPNGAHFSGMIGASHNARYTMFAVGRKPTPGLERLSEEGKHSPLNTEIQSAIDKGNALMMFESGSLKNWKDSMVATVRVDPAHPLVDVVTMIAPSPDWFTGATDVSLVENGAWAKSRSLVLPPYDSGGDDGTSYNAPDKDTNPKKPTTRNTNRHFVVHGRVRPVAVLKFVRKA